MREFLNFDCEKPEVTCVVAGAVSPAPACWSRTLMDVVGCLRTEPGFQ